MEAIGFRNESLTLIPTSTYYFTWYDYKWECISWVVIRKNKDFTHRKLVIPIKRPEKYIDAWSIWCFNNKSQSQGVLKSKEPMIIWAIYLFYLWRFPIPRERVRVCIRWIARQDELPSNQVPDPFESDLISTCLPAPLPSSSFLEPVGQKGSRNVMYNRHIYHLDRKKNERTYWMCT